MSLNSEQLDAFFAVAKLGSFSKAALELHFSQPALSQRIRKLEESLKATLFIRETKGVVLTDTGERLLLYCRVRRDLEQEFLDHQKTGPLTGIIRVAGFSSVMRTAIMPALSDLITEHPDLPVELMTRELHELPQLLRTAQSDFVISTVPLSGSNVLSTLLGYEENVLIEATRTKGRIADVYFDHDAEDQTTLNFFKIQPKTIRKTITSRIHRSFLDEGYSIIEAVEMGWGRAVMPKHTIINNPKVKIVKEFTPLKNEVHLNYQAQAFYLPLHLRIQNDLLKKIPLCLKMKP